MDPEHLGDCALVDWRYLARTFLAFRRLRVKELDLVLVNKLTLELADQVLHIQHVNKARELLLHLLVLLNECLFLPSKTLEQGRQRANHRYLLVFVTLDHLLLLLERLEHERLEVTVAFLESLGESLILDHELAEAAGLLCELSLEVAREHL